MTRPAQHPAANSEARKRRLEEVRTPQEWCDLLGARIADPDGWRDGTRGWDEPIDRAEFDRRLLTCTIDSRGYPSFYKVAGR